MRYHTYTPPRIDSDRARRADPDRRRCHACGRIFAQYTVPDPMLWGPYRGELVCRDCRAVLNSGD